MTDMTAPVWEGDRAPFAKAFVVAQSAVEAVVKGAENQAFKRAADGKASKYADLSACVDAVKPALNKAGIGILQFPAFDGERVGVTTTLLHESGSSVSATLHMRPTKADPQGVGSAITYARRYALLAIVGAAPEDDDGNAASGQGEGGKRFDRSEQAAFVTAAIAAIDNLETEEACAKWYGDNVAALKQAAQDERNQVMAYLKKRKLSVAPKSDHPTELDAA